MGRTNQMAQVFCSGRLSATLVNNTAKSVKVTVGTAEDWVINAASMHNGDNVTRTCNLRILDSSDNVVMYLFANSTGTGSYSSFPAVPASAIAVGNPVLIKSGYKLEFLWSAGGASAGGTAYYSYTIERIFVQ